MATTRLTDIVPVKTFAKIVEGKVTENSKFRQSGLITTDARITSKAQTAGFEGTLPQWKPLPGGEAETMNDDPSVRGVPGKVEQVVMTARMIQRAKAIAAMDLTDYASDSDAIAYAATELARLWQTDEDSAVIAILKGLLADNVANDGGDMVSARHVTSGTIAAANVFGWDAVIAARKQLGDLGGELQFMIAHSDVVNNLRAKEPNAFVPASQTDIGLEKYGKYAIVETDNWAVEGTTNFPVYTTVFAGSGLLGYGAGSFGENALAQVRDEFAGNFSGQETIISRRRYILHPFGFSNKAPASNGVSQSNAELSASATWDRVVSRKAVPLVAIKTNG